MEFLCHAISKVGNYINTANILIIDALLETDYFKKKMLVSLKSDNRLNTVNKLIKQANLHAFLPRPASVYEGCSNMNASGFVTFFTYMLQQNGKRFFKVLYVTFKLVPDIKKNAVYLSRYSPLNEVHVSILTNPMLRTYTSDIDECITLRYTCEIS